MRITNEADYALRIVYSLLDGSQKSAKTISDETGVTLRFALKILRKLALAELMGSQQGATGGYFLKRAASEISVGEVIEIIDGPFQINNCMDNVYICSRMGKDTENCKFHQFFCELNEQIRNEMFAAKMDRFRD
ncbi:MAG: Rrf2 family transcriptional regulator [Clostridiaceae bacterium]|nr:Rrf2 family transcriptional regulator [Clostridiaceae bacterium]